MKEAQNDEVEESQESKEEEALIVEEISKQFMVENRPTHTKGFCLLNFWWYPSKHIWLEKIRRRGNYDQARRS